MPELSILIPARKEKYLAETVRDLLTKIESDTEIIVGIDGDKDYIEFNYPKVITYVSEKNIGQRAMTNRLALMSKAKFLMKIDAHVLFSKGFETELLKAMDDRTIMSPYLLALDAEKWKPIPQPATSKYCFDPDLIFHFDRENETEEMIEETMCLQGCAFIVSRETYWRWNLCDESLGSWGKQGVELGIKAYLNGGRCVTNKNCYVAHLFRKEFPYERNTEEIQKTLDAVTKRMKTKKIKGLIEKFGRPCGWTEEDVDKLP
jgi:glycosyltransferase involved in cell wall biosynthesis